MTIKIDKKNFFKVLRRYPNIEKEFFRKLNKEVIRSGDYEGRNRIVIKNIKELRGAHLFISIAKNASTVTINFTKSNLLKNSFIERLIVNSIYFGEN